MEDVETLLPVDLGVEDFRSMYAFTAQHASQCPCDMSRLLLPKLRNILDTLARAENEMFLAIIDEAAEKATLLTAPADPAWRH